MSIKKQVVQVLCWALLLSGSGVLNAQEVSVRVKDLASVIELRDNQLIGYGLVVGLRGSGDSRSTAFTNKALANILKKMGLTGTDKDFKSRNVASVMVTASLPPYAKRGQKISVSVSSLGDASSLDGGVLLMTPLQGADYKTYAVAQGSLIVGGISGQSEKISYVKNKTTVGRIPDGAIVEVEVPVTREDQQNITLVLKDNNFITASRVVDALIENEFEGAKAIDPSTIKVPVSAIDNLPYVDLVAKIENTLVIPDASAKVIINSRTGTVIIGEMVRLFPVGVTHGSVSIKVRQSGNLSSQYSTEGEISTIDSSEAITVNEERARVVMLEPDASLSSLVESLNVIGVTTKEMISIIQALKEANALIADIEVI